MKIKKKQSLSASFDSTNRHSPSNKRNGGPGLVTHRPLRERVIHILALKPYSKPELLLWLEREKASPKDKADLSPVLDEVKHCIPQFKCTSSTIFMMQVSGKNVSKPHLQSFDSVMH